MSNDPLNELLNEVKQLVDLSNESPTEQERNNFDVLLEKLVLQYENLCNKVEESTALNKLIKEYKGIRGNANIIGDNTMCDAIHQLFKVNGLFDLIIDTINLEDEKLIKTSSLSSLKGAPPITGRSSTVSTNEASPHNKAINFFEKEKEKTVVLTNEQKKKLKSLFSTTVREIIPPTILNEEEAHENRVKILHGQPTPPIINRMEQLTNLNVEARKAKEAREETARKEAARKEAVRKAKEAREEAAREEAVRKAKEAREEAAREEAVRKAKEEEARKAREEAIDQLRKKIAEVKEIIEEIKTTGYENTLKKIFKWFGILNSWGYFNQTTVPDNLWINEHLAKCGNNDITDVNKQCKEYIDKRGTIIHHWLRIAALLFEFNNKKKELIKLKDAFEKKHAYSDEPVDITKFISLLDNPKELFESVKVNKPQVKKEPFEWTQANYKTFRTGIRDDLRATYDGIQKTIGYRSLFVNKPEPFTLLNVWLAGFIRIMYTFNTNSIELKSFDEWDTWLTDNKPQIKANYIAIQGYLTEQMDMNSIIPTLKRGIEPHRKQVPVYRGFGSNVVNRPEIKGGTGFGGLKDDLGDIVLKF